MIPLVPNHHRKSSCAFLKNSPSLFVRSRIELLISTFDAKFGFNTSVDTKKKHKSLQLSLHRKREGSVQYHADEPRKLWC